MSMKVNGTSGLTFPDTTTLASAGQASVRAWVNFNGTGTVAIRASYNVASITDNGAGDYTVNFTTALPDANYSTNVTGSNGGGANGLVGFVNNNATAPTTSLVRLQIASSAFAAADASIVNVAIFR
jgi:hypothetical protein